MGNQIETFLLNWPTSLLPLAAVWYTLARSLNFGPTSLLRIASASIPGLLIAVMFWLLAPSDIVGYFVESVFAEPTNILAPLIIVCALLNKFIFKNSSHFPIWIEVIAIAVLAMGYVYDQVAIYSLGTIFD